MSWQYKITSEGNCSIYDHTDTHITTHMNDGSGHKIPDCVFEVMMAELDNRSWDLQQQYVRETLKDAIFENIEEKQA